MPFCPLGRRAGKGAAAWTVKYIFWIFVPLWALPHYVGNVSDGFGALIINFFFALHIRGVSEMMINGSPRLLLRYLCYSSKVHMETARSAPEMTLVRTLKCKEDFYNFARLLDMWVWSGRFLDSQTFGCVCGGGGQAYLPAYDS